ncbi:MAG: glycoside hydrolase family 3 protein [Proteobacteria bacterium]|nr:glycoside hydrolase family 3 protein [Pseudomonadota bacterium]
MTDLDLKNHLGQLLNVGFWGTTPDDPWIKILSRQIEEGKIGGLIFFGHNIQSPSQVLALTSYFKSLKAPYPLLMSIDEEGGRVERLSSQKGFSDFFGAEQVAEKFTHEEATGYYSALAQKLKQFGFNLNFAPVVDLNPEVGLKCPVIGSLGRSYGSQAHMVIAYARSFLKSHARLNVLTCLKHFPGHGRVQEDTHQGFADATETWKEEDLIPFKTLLGEAPCIMTSHLSHQQWEKKLPLTFSKDLITGLLREKLGFSGVITTDDLHMGAIQNIMKTEEAALKALLAGHDLLTISNNPNACKSVPGFAPSPMHIEKILKILTEAFEDKILSASFLRDAIERILKLKTGF